MTKRIDFLKSLGTAPQWAAAWKYADPTEEARWVSQEEAEEIAREDPGLLEWIA